MDTGVDRPRDFPLITVDTDTRDILAHGRRYADKHNLDDYVVVDIDAHHSENASWWDIIAYVDDPVVRQMGESFKDRPGRPSAFLTGATGLAYQDVNGRIPHQTRLGEKVEETDVHRDVTLARRVMGALSSDYMVIFPTPMLSLGSQPDDHIEAVLARAYSRWSIDHLMKADPSLKLMVYLPFNSPEACEKLVEELGNETGVVGFCVTSVRNVAVHHNKYMRLYRMIEETGKPLSFHAGFNWHDGSISTTNRFISMHSLSFVHCNIVHMTNWLINGLPERFPRLKVVWIESGLAWIPYLMQRLDNEYMMRTCEAPLLKRRPSEYMREMFYTSQPMEMTHPKLMEAGFEAFSAETQLLYASDWPHWDFDTPGAILDLPFLSDQAKRNILGENALRAFNLERPKPGAGAQK